MKLRGWLTFSAVLFVFVLAGCSRADPRAYVPAPPAADEGGEGGDTVAGGPTNIEIAADPGGALAFTAETLEAVAGQPLNVTFTNPESSGQPHNWVLVEPGQEDAVAQAALPNQGNVPAGTPGAIVAGAVQPAGNTEEITVESPLEPGTYSYICTVPGHYAAGMAGTLNVGEATAGAEGGDGAAGGDEGASTGALAVNADPGGALAFEQTALTAAADQAFTVTFDNPESSGQPHNWVLVEQGQEQAVATAALPNQGNVPEGTEGVITAGQIIQAGNSEEIQVPALPAGTYTYVCTFPGHTASMRGELTIE